MAPVALKRFLMLGTLCRLVCCAAEDEPVRLTALVPASDSLKEHNTQYYRMNEGFVVRRGQPFDLELTFDAEISEPQFSFLNNDPIYGSGMFSVAGQRKENESSYVVTITTPAHAPVGKYTKIMLSVEHANGKLEYAHPEPLFVLLNPWIPEEEVVFVPEEMRQEYLLNEYGAVFQGSLEDHQEAIWYYGQFDQIVLDALFHVLDNKLEREHAGDPIALLQTISQWQGIVTMGKHTVGEASVALLEGNWFGPFESNTEPTRWSSVPDILRRWRQTGKPAQFGQCWVFAALQNALCRAAGVGSRQVSGFGARVDATSMRDPERRYHHQVNLYTDENGKSVHMEGMVWNFHSWDEVYVNFQDAQLAGFASLDGTPSGTYVGPAPTKAVFAQDDTILYNATFTISTVHATVNNYVVQCKPNHTKKDKLKGCHVLGQTSSDTSGLHLMTSSKTLENGSYVMDNITDQFVDASRNPEVPWPQAVSIRPKTYDVTVGEDIEGTVDLDTKELKEGEYVQVNMRFTLETYTGEETKEVMVIKQRVLIKGSKVSLPWAIDRDSYVEKNMDEGYLRMVVVASGADGKFYMDQRVLSIDAPKIQFEGPDRVKCGSGNIVITARFTNPVDFNLDDVCVRVHSYGLRFVDQPTDTTEKFICTALKAHEDLTVNVNLEAPSDAGLHYILASVTGDYLPSSSAYATVEVVEHSVSTSTALIAALIVLSAAIAVAIACFCVRRRRARVVEGGYPDAMGASLQAAP